jgi:membrane-bound serine protease (ClpP class)
MEILLNPNIAYLLLAAGVFFAALAILSPGSGVLEIFGLTILLLAGWVAYSMEETINWWALIVLLISFVLLLLAMRYPDKLVFLASAIFAMVVGSAFLFGSEDWWYPAVNPILALVVSIFMGGFFWIVGRKILEARSVRPTHDLEGLIGERGTAKSDIHEEGSVQVAGELWTASSKEPIREGTTVEVIERDGFVLVVEPVEDGGF